MADALTKLAIVEERQTQTILAQERAFKALERVEERQRTHELVCKDQDKEVRQLIADSNERLATRVAELEKAEPMQEQTSTWVRAAVWGAAGLAVLLIAKQLGLV
jgi:anti-sigma-K factor RskA